MERTYKQIQEHYEVEKELATRLRNSTREQRTQILGSMYDELFRRVPHHPRLHRKDNLGKYAEMLSIQINMLVRYLTPKSIFMEIGCGDGQLSYSISGQVSKVYGVDITDILIPKRSMPPNFNFVITNGVNIDLPDEYIDVAYSTQLMEHLHPEDAIDQLREIFRILAHGGIYICVTPNYVTGPHDISKYFDEVATGFHLKEYKTTELRRLFHQNGFELFRVRVGPSAFHLLCPPGPCEFVEEWLLRFPHKLRRNLARKIPFRWFVGMLFVGKKG